jgi:hypothetical protein
MFRPNTAYLIDIVDHGGWTREHVFKTVVSAWPDQNLFWELKGILPQFSDDQGSANAIAPCPQADLLILHYVPEAA